MYTTIKGSLECQLQALELLHKYQDMEYICLRDGDIESVEVIENYIIKLVQIAFDARVELKRLLDGQTLADYRKTINKEAGDDLFLMHTDVEYYEGECKRKAERNGQYARALDEAQMRRIGALYGVMIGSVEFTGMRVH